MKKIFSVIIVFFSAATLTNAQLKKANEKYAYLTPFQIDSSDNYIIGVTIDRGNKTKYDPNRLDYSTMGYYNNWVNILIYNSKTHQSKKIFNQSPVLVYNVIGKYTSIDYNYTNIVQIGSSFLIDQGILLVAKTDEKNLDGVIDDDDPTNVYICTNEGEKLTQLNPKETSAKGLKFSKDRKTLFLNLENDSTKETYLYQITLNTEFEKIKGFPLKF
jgi:hypothetical protein